MFNEAASYSGGFVKIDSDLKSLPVLEREGCTPVYVYQFIDAINGLVDYDDIMREYPGLTYSQINGAFNFLRRLSQFNTAMVGIDALENEFNSDDKELIEGLRDAFRAGEPDHVLTAG